MLLQYQVEKFNTIYCLAYDKKSSKWPYYWKMKESDPWNLSKRTITSDAVKSAFNLDDEELTYIKLKFSV